MCADCFSASEHRKHRYQKIPSGGGFCDCGDEEAFITHATCDTHKELKASGVATLKTMNFKDFTNVSHGLLIQGVH
jgi:hypothetical protein